jgi:hypothetical protein
VVLENGRVPMPNLRKWNINKRWYSKRWKIYILLDSLPT